MFEGLLAAPTNYVNTTFPPSTRQLCYFGSGCLAGAATLPVEALWSRFRAPGSPATHFSKNFPGPLVSLRTIYRAGFRFWTFDITRSQLNRHVPSLPVAVTGGLGGAAGGFVEVCAESFISRRPRLPSPLALANQSAKLFFCFGTYTFLSTNLSPEQLPPKPFPFCWALGAIAGGTGSGILAALEGVRGATLWKVAVPKGALIIGTVISVHVTSCAEILKKFGR